MSGVIHLSPALEFPWSKSLSLASNWEAPQNRICVPSTRLGLVKGGDSFSPTKLEVLHPHQKLGFSHWTACLPDQGLELSRKTGVSHNRYYDSSTSPSRTGIHHQTKSPLPDEKLGPRHETKGPEGRDLDFSIGVWGPSEGRSSPTTLEAPRHQAPPRRERCILCSTLNQRVLLSCRG